MVAEHRVMRIWQERAGEVSWRCTCGFTHKHQRFDVTMAVDVDMCPASVWVSPSPDHPAVARAQELGAELQLSRYDAQGRLVQGWHAHPT